MKDNVFILVLVWSCQIAKETKQNVSDSPSAVTWHLAVLETQIIMLKKLQFKTGFKELEPKSPILQDISWKKKFFVNGYGQISIHMCIYVAISMHFRKFQCWKLYFFILLYKCVCMSAHSTYYIPIIPFNSAKLLCYVCYINFILYTYSNTVSGSCRSYRSNHYLAILYFSVIPSAITLFCDSNFRLRNVFAANILLTSACLYQYTSIYIYCMHACMCVYWWF